MTACGRMIRYRRKDRKPDGGWGHFRRPRRGQCKRPQRRRKLALGMAIAEHVALYPLCYLIDRYHPARGEPGVPPLLTNPRAFAQATWRHALFGTVLGRLA